MKLAVLGATGRVGRLVVGQALDAGHRVTAFTRSPEKLDDSDVPVDHDRLRVLPGDVHEPAQVAEAVQGQDAILSTVGMTKSSGSDVLTVLAENVLAPMQQHGVSRIVSLVGAGVTVPEDGSPSFGRVVMRGLMKIMVRQMLEDAQRHADILRDSDVDWTLVRPPRLIDDEKKGAYRTGYLDLGVGDKISRADVADFMLQLATSGGFERQAPMVSY